LTTDLISAAEISKEAFRNFADACRSSETRTVYTQSLHYFMDYLRLSQDDYDKLLPPTKDPRTIQNDIRDYIKYLKNKGIAYSTRTTYVASLSKFYAQNQITLNWKWIKSFMGEHEKVAEDKPYTHAEIQTLLANADRRNRAIILTMCSSGARVGSISLLRLRDLEPIDQYGIYKLHFYATSKTDHYYGYCTPECRKAIDDYLEYRRRWNERLSDDSPLFRIDYNAVNGVDRDRKGIIKPLSKHGIRNFMAVLLLQTGLRKIPTENRAKRLDRMTNHGLRKFYETNAYRAGMDNMYIRRLMGHKSKSNLEEAYLKISDEELLEGDSKHVGFVGIIGQLTIDDSQRLKRENQILQINKDRLEARLDKLEELYKKLDLD
jgi:integrase